MSQKEIAWTKLVLATVLTLSGVLPIAAHAQSGGSTVFIPYAAPRSSVPGRSTDRERDPAAWGITDEQWNQFRAFALAANKPMKVTIRLNNLRARQFEEDLAELLISIPGWTVDDQGIYTAGTLASFDGILIQNNSAVDPSPDAQFIKDALLAAGILPEAQFDPTQPGKVRIVIGAPPEK